MSEDARTRASRQPWIKWYTRDWRSDPPLRMCSFAARGLWADLLTLMAEANVVGFLLIEGVAPTPRDLAGLLGGTEREIKKLVDELGGKNVFSVTGRPMPDDVAALVPSGMANGVMLSRRMVRDKSRADRDRENGKGGGNPKLGQAHNRPVNPSVNPGVNPPANPQSQSQNQRSDSSVAKATAAPGGDLASLLFGQGLAWLQDTTHKPRDRCAALLGKWRKAFGSDEALLASIGKAQREGAIDPVGWMEAAIKARQGNGAASPRSAWADQLP